eukprot:6491968-Pyramimonas_sp.AAC.1
MYRSSVCKVVQRLLAAHAQTQEDCETIINEMGAPRPTRVQGAGPNDCPVAWFAELARNVSPPCSLEEEEVV